MKNLSRRPFPARSCFLLVVALLAALAGRAQAPGWDGAYLSGLNPTSGSSYTNAVATDAQGNVFVTGQFTGTVMFGSITLTTAGGDDVFVAKFVPGTNTWAWAQRAGGTSADAGYGIAVSGHSVYVTGLFYNSLGNANNVTFGGTGPGTSLAAVAGANAAASDDLFVTKFVDTGSSAFLGWVQVGGGTGGAGGTDVAVSGDQVYVLGYVFNNRANSRAVVFGGDGTTPGTVPVRGASGVASDDWVLARYTDYGGAATLDWTQVAGGTSGDYGAGLAVSGTSVYVTGYLTNDNANTNAVVLGGSGNGPAGTSPQAGASSTADGDLMLVKYTDNGTTGSYVWSQVGGGTGFDAGSGVAVSGTSVYVTGGIANNTGNARAVLFGGSGLAAGTSPVSGATPVVSDDLLLVKYQDNGATGAYVWSQVGGGTRSEGGSAVAVSGNRLYLTATLENSAGNAAAVVLGGAPLPGLGPTIDQDLLLACYLDNGTTGTYAWGRLGGGNSSDSGRRLAVSGQQLYVGGYTAPPATFGPTTLTAPRTGIFGVLARLTDPALTPLPVRAGRAAPGLTLYPNPTRAAAVLTGAAPGAVVQVLDLPGRVVATTAADAAGTATLPPLPTGLYLVRAGAATGRLRVE